MKILVVEDEVLLGIDLADTLETHGFEVIGPFARAEDAIKAADTETPDAALLDFNLGRHLTSEAAADHLTAMKIPFAFLTGHAQTFLPDRYGDVPVMEKPFSNALLLKVLNEQLSS